LFLTDGATREMTLSNNDLQQTRRFASKVSDADLHLGVGQAGWRWRGAQLKSNSLSSQMMIDNGSVMYDLTGKNNLHQEVI